LSAIWIIRGDVGVAANLLAQASSDAIASHIFGVVPLFVLTGFLVAKADIGKDAFEVANQLFRRLRGGLGVATVASNAVFAAITGISIASAAVFTRVAVPQMVRFRLPAEIRGGRGRRLVRAGHADPAQPADDPLRPHATPLRRPVDLPRERRPVRPAGLRAQDPVLHHENTYEQIAPFFPGLKKEDLPDGEGWAVETVQLSTHNGTHLDAPYHFHSTMDKALGEKKPAIAIDEVPLEWCFQPGVKLDFRHFADGYVVTAADVEAELARIGHTLQPLEIVVVNTRAGSRYGQGDYVSAGCGMGYEATMYLLERGVRLTGTDAWSWDAPFVHTAQKYAETQDAKPDLGRPQGRPRHRLLPPREAAQPGVAAAHGLLHQLLPAQDPRRLGRLDARGGDLRRRADGVGLRGRGFSGMMPRTMSSTTPTTPPPAAGWPRPRRPGRLPDPEPALRRVPPPGPRALRGGVAIGDQVIDLAAWPQRGRPARAPAARRRAGRAAPALNALLAMGPAAWRALRHALFDACCTRAPQAARARRCAPAWCRRPPPNTPAHRIGDYTDFYTSIHHARNVGRVIRPDDPLTPNFQWLPIAYHGRASSVVVSGTPFHRPMGQAMPPGAHPVYGACARLDFELEMGFWSARATRWASACPLEQAEPHLRHVPAQRLVGARPPVLGDGAAGPLPGQELLHQRVALDRHHGGAGALPRALRAPRRRAAAAALPGQRRVPRARRRSTSSWRCCWTRQRTARRAAADRLSATSFRHQYWTPAQMLTQHTVGGCNLQPATCWAPAPSPVPRRRRPAPWSS
jgi:kynurenine formamidase